MNIATNHVEELDSFPDPLQDLNEGQKGAAEDYLQFLLSPDKEFALCGPGGVGKTYTLKKMLTTVIDEYQKACAFLGRNAVNYEIAVTATTNKATEVLRVALGRPATTVHSFLGLKVRTDYKTGVKSLVKTDKWMVWSNMILVVDEASMIDEKLKKLIDEAMDSSCKIVYVGDHCQLAPVKEQISKVYSEEKRFSILTQPMRNADQPALIDFCSKVRKVVETLDFSPIQDLPNVPGVIDHLTDDEAAEFIDEHFIDEEINARILAYSNVRVNEYNTYLRDLRGYPTKFIEGERLIAAQAMSISNRMTMQVEEEVRVVEDQGKSHFVVDSSDANAVIETQKLRIRSTRLDAVVQVATNPAHAQVLKKHYFKHKDWQKAYSIEEKIADLRPRSACTVHKSQGSTYDMVFIDLKNIGKCTHNNELARMLYVAVTRARSRIVLHGSLPARLFV